MSEELEGTRAFIIGGGTGIGQASAIALAAQGCFVTVAGRTQHTLDETVALVREAGGSAAAVLCDVSVVNCKQLGGAWRGLRSQSWEPRVELFDLAAHRDKFGVEVLDGQVRWRGFTTLHQHVRELS